MIRKKRAAVGWRGPVLRALARGLSYSAAAREAGIDPSSVHRVRQRDPGFAAACLKARDKGVAKLSKSEPALAPTEVLRGSRSGRPQVQRAGPGRWSAAKEALFLEQLAATCNISAACRAAGVSNVAVYNRRRLWPVFAQGWRDALDGGYHRLEALLLGTATATLEGGAVGGAGGGAGAAGGARPFVAPMTVDQAITVWRMHQKRVTGEGPRARHDWRRVPKTLEEIQAEILRRLRAIGDG